MSLSHCSTQQPWQQAGQQPVIRFNRPVTAGRSSTENSNTDDSYTKLFYLKARCLFSSGKIYITCLNARFCLLQWLIQEMRLETNKWNPGVPGVPILSFFPVLSWQVMGTNSNSYLPILRKTKCEKFPRSSLSTVLHRYHSLRPHCWHILTVFLFKVLGFAAKSLIAWLRLSQPGAILPTQNHKT